MAGFAIVRNNKKKPGEKEYRKISMVNGQQKIDWSFDPNDAMNCDENDAKAIRDQLRKNGDTGYTYHREFLDD